ncbi:MAG: DUF6265 family protein [Phycisphaerae bacterium]|nr:DUF6265 family protein [Phycisphaerae bacterium]
MRYATLTSTLLALPLAALLLMGGAMGVAKGTGDPPKSTLPLSTLGFLAGNWSSSGDDGFSEEIWSAPRGSSGHESMMGAFRWLKPDGSPMMFEMLTITVEPDATRLRLRHYTPTLTAKEDADKPLTLKLTQSSSSRAVFEAEKDAHDLSRIVYEVTGDELKIAVEFVQGEKPREPLKFVMKRTVPTAGAPAGSPAAAK